MKVTMKIPFLLPGLNDYTNAERKNRHCGAALKANTQEMISWAIRQQLRGVRFSNPVQITYLWIEQNKKRDKDNIAFAQKFVQDALVSCGVLSNDGWKQVDGFSHSFSVDKEHPGVVVTLDDGRNE